MMEIFILLHEYGHVVCGHLKKGNVRHINFPGGADVVVYNKTQEQEFEADMFAFNKMSSAMLQEHGNARAKLDIAMHIGILLKFFELCDSCRRPLELISASHPPASERWKRIAEAAEAEKYPASVAANLDKAFSVIMFGNPEVAEEDAQPEKSAAG
jgi:hypothetical protein